MSDQGQTYLTFIEGELKAERERRAAYDARGQALVTTSGALVTLLAGLAAVVKGGTTSQISTGTVMLVVLALSLFVCAAACGIVAGWNRHYALATFETLNRMLNEHWTDDEADARNSVATLHSLIVRTLRQANAFKAACVSVGLVVHVLALVALGVSVVLLNNYRRRSCSASASARTASQNLVLSRSSISSALVSSVSSSRSSS